MRVHELLASAIGVMFLAYAGGARAAGPAEKAGASSGFLQALALLNSQVEAIADDVAIVCRRDVSNLQAVETQLAEMKKLDQVLGLLKRRYGALAEFPSAEARRIGGRIASVEDSLVRLDASAKLVRDRGDGGPSGQLFFEAVQTVCPGDDAASVFDDVCKIQGGTPGETCSDCFFGLFSCCEKFCAPN
jgi:hypothetical protein